MARPRAFDETAAVEAALGTFWGRGYEATSVRDLADSMGIAGPSLYNAFGDKHGLFTSALEHYCRTRTYPMLAQIEARHAGTAIVPAFFAEIIERSLTDRQRRGCFLINSALDMAPHDEAVARAVAEHLGAVRAFLARGLRAAAKDMDQRIAGGIDGAADHLLAVLLGIRVLARTRPDRNQLTLTVRAALASVGYAAADLRLLGPARRRARAATRRKVRPNSH